MSVKLLPNNINTPEIKDLIASCYRELLDNRQLPEATVNYLTILATNGAGCSRYWSAANKLNLASIDYRSLRENNRASYNEAIDRLENLLLAK
jgi:hypothetical protein